MSMQLDIYFYWWESFHFTQDGFIMSFSQFHLTSLEAAMVQLRLKNMLRNNKDAFIQLDSILNGLELQTNLTTSIPTKWSLLLLLVFFKWPLVLFLIYLGIFLKMINTQHFRNYIDMIFEWIPQQIFFFCTFGYMCILILYKWTIPWGIPV